MASSSALTEELVNQAWIGDAVLSLYARQKVLRESGGIDGEALARLTSNQFLGSLGEPTKVEAAIGRVFAAQGLPEAFQWIEDNLIPLFVRQEANRLRKSAKR